MASGVLIRVYLFIYFVTMLRSSKIERKQGSRVLFFFFLWCVGGEGRGVDGIG